MGTLLIEFLISKKYVTEVQAVEALQEQCARLPSVSEIVTKLELLAPKDHLNVLLVQAKGAWSFQQAATQLGLWNQNLEKKLKTEIENSALPVSQILIEKGHLTTESLMKAFQEFQEPELPEFISKPKLEQIKDRASKLPTQATKLHFETLFHDFHHLKGVAVFHELTVLTDLVDRLETLFLDLMSDANDRLAQFPAQISEFALSGLRLIPKLTHASVSGETAQEVQALCDSLNQFLTRGLNTGPQLEAPCVS